MYFPPSDGSGPHLETILVLPALVTHFIRECVRAPDCKRTRGEGSVETGRGGENKKGGVKTEKKERRRGRNGRRGM